MTYKQIKPEKQPEQVKRFGLKLCLLLLVALFTIFINVLMFQSNDSTDTQFDESNQQKQVDPKQDNDNI